MHCLCYSSLSSLDCHYNIDMFSEQVEIMSKKEKLSYKQIHFPKIYFNHPNPCPRPPYPELCTNNVTEGHYLTCKCA